MDNKLNDLTTSLNENLDITELSEKKVKISEL
jgi:hypothetical protein